LFPFLAVEAAALVTIAFLAHSKARLALDAFHAEGKVVLMSRLYYFFA
jgi:hypothetical protein